jgi:cytochrome c5
MKKRSQLFVLAFVAVFFASCAGGGNSESKSSTKTGTAKKEMTVDLANGQATYDKVCMACHLTGVAGAAKISDTQRWAEVAPKGLNELQKSVINGIPDGKYGVMPERGSCPDCSDKDLYDAVAYILSEAGVLDKAK